MISFSRKEFNNFLGGGMCVGWWGGVAGGGYTLCCWCSACGRGGCWGLSIRWKTFTQSSFQALSFHFQLCKLLLRTDLYYSTAPPPWASFPLPYRWSAWLGHVYMGERSDCSIRYNWLPHFMLFNSLLSWLPQNLEWSPQVSFWVCNISFHCYPIPKPALRNQL